MPGVPSDRLPVGTPAPVLDLRARGVQRLVAQPPRPRPCTRRGIPHRAVVRAGRALALVLPARVVRLDRSSPPTPRSGGATGLGYLNDGTPGSLGVDFHASRASRKSPSRD